jgi:hypothetical protein
MHSGILRNPCWSNKIDTATSLSAAAGPKRESALFLGPIRKNHPAKRGLDFLANQKTLPGLAAHKGARACDRANRLGALRRWTDW